MKIELVNFPFSQTATCTDDNIITYLSLCAHYSLQKTKLIDVDGKKVYLEIVSILPLTNSRENLGTVHYSIQLNPAPFL